MPVRKIKNLATPSVLVDSQSGTDISEINPLPITIMSSTPTATPERVKKLKNLVTPIVLVASETGQDISDGNPLPVYVVGGISPSGDVSQIVTTLQAQEDISAMKLVSAGLYLADKDVLGRERVVGIARDFISSGANGVIITDGIVQDASFSFVVGNPIYLSNSGNLTQVAPSTGYWTKIGTAVKTNALKLELQMEPIKL